MKETSLTKRVLKAKGGKKSSEGSQKNMWQEGVGRTAVRREVRWEDVGGDHLDTSYPQRMSKVRMGR